MIHFHQPFVIGRIWLSDYLLQFQLPPQWIVRMAKFVSASDFSGKCFLSAWHLIYELHPSLPNWSTPKSDHHQKHHVISFHLHSFSSWLLSLWYNKSEHHLILSAIHIIEDKSARFNGKACILLEYFRHVQADYPQFRPGAWSLCICTRLILSYSPGNWIYASLFCITFSLLILINHFQNINRPGKFHSALLLHEISCSTVWYFIYLWYADFDHDLLVFFYKIYKFYMISIKAINNILQLIRAILWIVLDKYSSVNFSYSLKYSVFILLLPA